MSSCLAEVSSRPTLTLANNIGSIETVQMCSRALTVAVRIGYNDSFPMTRLILSVVRALFM